MNDKLTQEDVVEQLEAGSMAIMALIDEVYRYCKPRYAFVLSVYYGFNRDRWTLTEIGLVLKVSTERVRQIRMAAERDLWKHLARGSAFSVVPWVDQ